MSIYILVKWSLFQIKDYGETKNIASKHLFRLAAANRKLLAALQVKKNMNNQIVFGVDGLIEVQIRQKDKNYTKVCCQDLLNYAYRKGLLCDSPCDNEGNPTIPSIIKGSSLTEVGKHIFVESLFKWFAYIDNESGEINGKNNIKMLEKRYN